MVRKILLGLVAALGLFLILAGATYGTMKAQGYQFSHWQFLRIGQWRWRFEGFHIGSETDYTWSGYDIHLGPLYFHAEQSKPKNFHVEHSTARKAIHLCLLSLSARREYQIYFLTEQKM